jgi:hypothetical protein
LKSSKNKLLDVSLFRVAAESFGVFAERDNGKRGVTGINFSLIFSELRGKQIAKIKRVRFIRAVSQSDSLTARRPETDRRMLDFIKSEYANVLN